MLMLTAVKLPSLRAHPHRPGLTKVVKLAGAWRVGVAVGWMVVWTLLVATVVVKHAIPAAVS